MAERTHDGIENKGMNVEAGQCAAFFMMARLQWKVSTLARQGRGKWLKESALAGWPELA
ncbi:MAG: hypothetical protein HY508_10415 [Acidobacteria bacterium]|nr:hypothetical protein [Acidobacteriota bacterium]